MADLLNLLYRASGNWQYLLVLVLIFCTAASAGAALVLLLTRRDRPGRRLARLLPRRRPTAPQKPRLLEEEDQGLVTRVATPLSAIFSPSTDAGRRKARLRLVQAGFRSRRSYRYFLALQALLTVLLPVAFLVRCMFFRLTPAVLLVCLILAAIGFLIPDLGLRLLIRQRQQNILRALPDALDLMVICAEAGLGLDMIFRRVGEEIRPLSVDLSDEFNLFTREVRAGRGRDESFRNLAQRTGVGEIQNLMALLIQTNRFGTSMAKALRIHAEGMRTKRRQLAEERAAKAAVKLVFPLICFIFPAIMVVLAGPAVLKIMQSILPVLGARG